MHGHVICTLIQDSDLFNYAAYCYMSGKKHKSSTMQPNGALEIVKTCHHS